MSTTTLSLTVAADINCCARLDEVIGGSKNNCNSKHCYLWRCYFFLHNHDITQRLSRIMLSYYLGGSKTQLSNPISLKGTSVELDAFECRKQSSSVKDFLSGVTWHERNIPLSSFVWKGCISGQRFVYVSTTLIWASVPVLGCLAIFRSFTSDRRVARTLISFARIKLFSFNISCG